MTEMRKESIKMNASVFQVEFEDQYIKKFKKLLYNLSLEDVMWLAHQKPAEDLFVLTKLKNEMNSFEKMWGAGSMAGAFEEIKTLDDEKRKGMYTSLRRIKAADKLKFVESPKNTTRILGEFGKSADGRIFVTGYANIKTDEEWHPIYYWNSFDDNKRFHNKEANVACKEGGYSFGMVVGREFFEWGPSPWLKYIEVSRCTGREMKLSDCPIYHVYYKDHWLTNVKLKCFI